MGIENKIYLRHKYKNDYGSNYFINLFKKSQRERDEILAKNLEQVAHKGSVLMGRKMTRAKLSSIVGAVDTAIKNKQLLAGKATEINKIDFTKMSEEEIKDYLDSGR